MIKVGFIGAGSVAKIHKISIDFLQDVSVVSLVKENNESSAERCAELGIEAFYEDIKAMLSSCEIQVVHCLLPNHLHYTVVREALESGKHVMAEKPFTMSIKEGLRLVEIASETNLVCGVNFRYRYYPAIQEMRKVIANGELGDIYMIHTIFFQDWLSDKEDFNWRLDPKNGGKSATFADIGSHVFDLIEYITEQKIDCLLSHLKTVIKLRNDNQYNKIPMMLDDYSAILFETEKGVPGSVVASQVSTGHGMSDLRIEVIGSRCSVAWNRQKPVELVFGYREERNKVFCCSDNNYHSWEHGICQLMSGFYRDVCAHIEDRNTDKRYRYPLFKDGLRGMKLLDAALKSHELATWVKVDNI